MIHHDLYDVSAYSGEHVMRTTLIIEDDLIKKASMLTGVKEKTSLVRMGLETLIARESSRRLAKLGGTEKRLEAPRRRRPKDV
jgi:hypothetical protein